MMDFDDFDAEDAAVLGGIIGFAEESVREENAPDPSEPESWDSDDIEPEPRMSISIRRQLDMLGPEMREAVLSSVMEFRKARELDRASNRLRDAMLREAKICEKEERENGFYSEESEKRMLEAFFDYRNGGLVGSDYEEYPDLFYFDEIIGEGGEIEIEYLEDDAEEGEEIIIRPIGHIKHKGRVYLEALVEPSGIRRFFRIDCIKKHRLPRQESGSNETGE